MSANWSPNPAADRIVQRAAEQGAQDAADVVLRESKRNTPVDTRRLVDSAHLVGSGLEQAVVYDDTSTIAAAVHEDLTEHHQHGGAKFLERAMNSQQQEALEAAARPLRAAFGG